MAPVLTHMHAIQATCVLDAYTSIDLCHLPGSGAHTSLMQNDYGAQNTSHMIEFDLLRGGSDVCMHRALGSRLCLVPS